MEVWEVHPALVHYPIALLLASVALDLYAWGRREALASIATGLMLAGVLAAAVAALAGVVAFFTVPPSHTDEAHNLVLWHIGAAVAMMIVFGVALALRWRARTAPPSIASRALGLVAAVTLIVAAALGGRLVYHGGMGVETKILAPELQEKS